MRRLREMMNPTRWKETLRSWRRGLHAGHWLAIIAVLLILGVIFTNALRLWPNMIDNEQARVRFAELAGVDADEVVIVRHTNSNSLLGGDAYDVTYELQISGKPIGGRCISKTFSPMICRLYDSGLTGD